MVPSFQPSNIRPAFCSLLSCKIEFIRAMPRKTFNFINLNLYIHQNKLDFIPDLSLVMPSNYSFLVAHVYHRNQRQVDNLNPPTK